MPDLDPAVIMAKHSPDGWADDGQGWCPSCGMFIVGPGCEAYRLAEALAAEQAKVARAWAWYRDESGLVDESDLAAALADQPERGSGDPFTCVCVECGAVVTGRGGDPIAVLDGWVFDGSAWRCPEHAARARTPEQEQGR